jgi:hypothetical protein
VVAHTNIVRPGPEMICNDLQKTQCFSCLTCEFLVDGALGAFLLRELEMVGSELLRNMAMSSAGSIDKHFSVKVCFTRD